MPVAIEPAIFPWGDYRRYTFSLGVELGAELVLSGQTAAGYDRESRRMVLPRGLAAQTHEVYDKIEAVLAAGGRGLDDVIRVVEYVTAEQAGAYAEVADVRRERFRGVAPVITTLCVDRLLRPEAHVEIAVVARRGDGLPSTPLQLPSLHAGDTPGLPFPAQVDLVLDRADEALAAIGCTWEDVAFAMEHVVTGDGNGLERTALDRADRIGERRTAGIRVGMRRLVPEGALLQLDLTVSRTPVDVVVEGSPSRPAGLAEAVRSGDRVYLSTDFTSASRDDAHEADVRVQVDAAYRRLLSLVAAAGGRPEDLVETVEYVTHDGLDGYAATAEVRRALLPLPYTAATGTVCAALDDPGSRFALYGTAVVGLGDAPS
jgi:enamine deaminase RidA (YjgF/YER057c/UK114 family)